MALCITRQTLAVLHHGHIMGLSPSWACHSPALPAPPRGAPSMESMSLLIKHHGHDGCAPHGALVGHRGGTQGQAKRV